MLQRYFPQTVQQHGSSKRAGSLPVRGHPVLSLLVDRGRLTVADMDRALEEAERTRKPVAVVAARMELVTGREWARLVADLFGSQLAGPDDIPSTAVLPNEMATRFLRQNWILPLSANEKQLRLAMADPDNEAAIKAVKLATGRSVLPLVIAIEDLQSAYSRLYDSGRSALQQIVDDLGGDAADDYDQSVDHLIDLAKEAPVVRLVNQILSDALRMRASDVHIEPFHNHLQVRYRIHGRLREISSPPAKLSAAVISRIKILAKLDIAERRLPQDGRTHIELMGRRVDLRVATMPTMHGESLVIRLLDNADGHVNLSELGLEARVEQHLRGSLSASYGMILVTGPTGSGKTTTLYAALQTLDAVEDKIISIEDPVEYQIEGITQIQVRPEIDLTFARILRSVIRHDPNIIMVGETRDGETADIAVHAALTGHLLLSTLHTNSAAGAAARLLDMGVEPYLLASVLRAVMGQRLVGVLCEHCREAYPAGADEKQLIAALSSKVPDGEFQLYRPVGCQKCDEIGFVGRVGIFEYLAVDETVRNLIHDRAPTSEIAKYAGRSGMTTMFDDGLTKALAGITTLEEVCKVTEGQ